MSVDLFDKPEVEPGTATFVMRSPCKFCQTAEGRIETKNGQDCVYCVGCGKHCYNAPKTETGRKQRSVQTTHEAIRPKTRSIVLERANGRCEMCGNARDLHVGHLIPVEAGHVEGLTDAEINHEENLCALCGECNLGMGKRPVSLRFAVRLLMSRFRFLGAGKGAEA